MRRVSITEDQIPQHANAKILRVILKNGDIIQFNKDGGRYIEKPLADRLYKAIVGVTMEAKVVEISPDKVLDIRIETKSENVLGTLFLVLSAAAGTVFAIIIIALGSSHGR
jgi:hypothetical protein